ncbi:MAG TPA: copper homeostasis membrane protein CopD, partial [Casimicrobiaceae bacterium]|nr:copper homeostasis membrane protein CopD [Casimicrobiaceae bacterium]
MNTLLIAARAVHFGTALWLFGEIALACALGVGRISGTSVSGLLVRRLTTIARLSIGVGIASAVAWLIAVAALMSGTSPLRAIAPATLGSVLYQTQFGHVWLLRFGLAAAVLALLWKPLPGDARSRLAWSSLVALAYLCAIAWTGHAAAAEGRWRGARIVYDAVHLAAAGAWLGALPGLVVLLRFAPALDRARVTQRFSHFATAYVIALVASGVGNSWFLVGSIPALIGTEYGRLVLVKVALLLVMLAFAAVNRMVLTPRLAGHDPEAARALRRNALVEIALGLLVVVVVGVLGTTVPAAHRSPVWPFAHTLAWRSAPGSTIPRPVLVPAYPTSYALPSVRYTTAAIVDGQRLFAQNCAACHGAGAAGDGPAAAALPTRPPNLVEHASLHRPGDLYWWIAHGRAGMPAFASALSDDEIWSVVDYLRALSEAAALPARPAAAPDFAFEVPGGGQQTLLGASAARGTLVVLYALPRSLPRLRELASA